MPQSAQSEVLIRISRIILPEEAEISIKAKNIKNFDIFFSSHKVKGYLTQYLKSFLLFPSYFLGAFVIIKQNKDIVFLVIMVFSLSHGGP